MSEHDVPVDLSPLDPTVPAPAFERRLGSVRQAFQPALRSRRAGGTPFLVVSRWRAPLMAALFLVMIVSAALMRRAVGDAAGEADAQDEIANALGLDSPLGPALLSDTMSPADVLLGGFEP